VSDRPYQTFGINDLEELAKNSDKDEAVLRAIKDELVQRSSTRANALRVKVNEYLMTLAFRAMNQGRVQPASAASPSPTKPRQNGTPAPASAANNGNGTSAPRNTAAPQVPPSPPPAETHPVPPEDVPLHDQLGRMRRRLLDLTAKNRLLNFRHTPTSCVRLIEEIPTHVFERVTRGEALEFAPLRPDDTDDDVELELPVAAAPGSTDAKRKRARQEAKAKAVATALGLDPSFDLPARGDTAARRHTDRVLQTLTLPAELESVLRKIHQKARTEIQEKGANVLHLLFGFIEWSDVPEGQTSRTDLRLAPLVLVPVGIERGRLDTSTRPRTYLYTVKATGEDWDTNVTLQEKCRRELRAELPGIEDDEQLEAYFARVEAWLASNTDGWRLRRYVTLGLVSFGKILMWRDLDPKTWPRELGLLRNPLLREVLGEDPAEGSSPGMLTDEYLIDDPPPDLQVPPIVVDADSSQHAVLVDVAKGRNLVVQGPPGTGKSQTIANLIAAEIHGGKRVLFVAEKKAALDVVHRRLTRIGLGPYCLALHSHTSDKKAFLGDLADRIRVRGGVSHPRDFLTVQSEIDQHRRRLNDYVRKLNTRHAILDLTVFEILWRARRLLDPLGTEAQKVIAGAAVPAALEFSRQQLEAAKSVVRDYGGNVAEVLEESGALGAHPWFGLKNAALAPVDIEQLLETGRAWAQALQRFEAKLESVNRFASMEVARSLRKVDSISEALSKVAVPPQIANSEMPRRVLMSRREAELARALDAVTVCRESWAAIEGPWGRPGYLSVEQLSSLRSAVTDAAGLCGCTTGFATVRGLVAELRQCVTYLTRVERLTTSIQGVLGVDLSASSRVFERLIAVARASCSVSDLALSLRSDALAGETARAELDDLARTADALVVRREALATTWPPSLRPAASALRDHIGAIANAPRFLPSIFSSKYRAAISAFRTATARKAPRAAMLQEYRDVLEFEDRVATLAGSPSLARLLGPAARGLDSPFAAALEAVAWRGRVGALSQGIGSDGARVQHAAWSVPAPAWREAAALCSQHAADAAAALTLPARLTTLARQLGHADRGWLDQPSNHLRAELDTLADRLDASLDALSSAGAADEVTIDALLHRLDLVRDAQKRDETARPLILELAAVAADPSSVPICDEVRAALLYVSSLRGTCLPQEGLVALLPGGQADALTSFRARLHDAVAAGEAMRALAKRFSELGSLDVSQWTGGASTDVEDADASVLRGRLEQALESAPTLYTWGRYLHSRAKTVDAGGEQVCGLVDARRISPTGAADAFEASAYNTVANAMLRSDPELARFSGTAHEQVRRRFAELDETSLKLMAVVIAHRLSNVPEMKGVSYGRVSDLTEESLVAQQASLQRPRVPIRDLFRRAGKAIVNLKPCLMMSPQAIAQFLPPGVMTFDLVVMDEASQIRPEDALGAIARAKQLVVVGDPMQLGPTSFFDRADDDDDDVSDDADERVEPVVPVETGPSVLERSESILTAAQARYPLRMLRWHYRSRHPKLIAFSNREFYGDDLIVFPTPEFYGAKEGVFFHRLDGAVYEGHRNVMEAEAVVEAVRKHAADHADQSLLVATLNYHQADLIDELLQKAEKNDSTLAEYRRRHAEGPEPLDVKNLENVQGDERDVILVSITFGPRPTGQFSRNFGPINQQGGERRLNVLFTRAKHRLEVFCSFDPRQLGVTDSSPRGLRVLHDYLRYAEDGAWATGAPTGREPDSDFEIAVARALRVRGFEVHPQVGVAGFWIDLGIVHPKKPGSYVLGVECDGASYHSGRSARDRDRLRQRALEGYGWNIHRIWSTDWFRDPAKQVEAVLARLESCAAQA
jgi:very-short-patch-repair endonuclease